MRTDPGKAASEPTLRERIRRGELLVGTFLNLGAPQAVELAGIAGLDWLLIDLEHGAGTESDLLVQLYAAEVTGVPAIVRVEVSARLRIGRVLDLGAAGIMVPRLESVDEVRTAVSYVGYPPDGVRGVALITRGAELGRVGHRDVHTKNAALPLVVQIENPQAVRDAAEIAAVDGVDVLFVVPTDLSHSLGIPGDFAKRRRPGTHEPRSWRVAKWAPALAALGRDDSADHHHTRRASFGSSRSRSPSPSTLTASTVSARQIPGKKMLCG